MRICLMFVLAMPIGFGCAEDQGPLSPNGKEPEIPLDSSFKRMTTGAYDDRPESWSPDGRLLAFTSDLRSVAYAGPYISIWIVDIENGDIWNPKQCNPYSIWPIDYRHPEFSPNGKLLTYEVANLISVYTISDDSCDYIASGGSPTWSPDGTEIGFFGDDYYEGFGIYIVALESQEKRKVCDLEEGIFWDLSWSRNGEWFAYIYRRQSWGQEEGPSHIALVPAAGGVPEPMFPEDEYDETGFDWTLDGAGIVFTSTKPGGGVWTYDLHHHRGPTLWMIDPIDTPRLSPDGASMAVGYCIAHPDSEECNIWVKTF